MNCSTQASLSVTNSWSSPKPMSIELMTIQPSHPLSSPSCALNIFQHQLIRWPNYWSFSFSISPSNEHSGLISFRKDWLDLLAVQETLKSLLQHHSSKAPILWCSAFFIVRLSHPYMTTGKIMTLTRWTFVGKVRTKWPGLMKPETWEESRWNLFDMLTSMGIP